MGKEYFAHSVEGKTTEHWQSLDAHLQSVAEHAATFAAVFGAKDWARLAGLFHDYGKCTEKFQQRLENDAIKAEHSIQGAKALKDTYGEVGDLLAYLVAGHHAGLPDWSGAAGSLFTRLQNSHKAPQVADSPAVLAHCKPPTAFPPNVSTSFGVTFFLRMLFSCLVDADFLDTEHFLQSEKSSARQGWASLDSLAERFFPKLQEMVDNAPGSHVNRVRARVLNDCLAKAPDEPGLFTLSVPTGGGKTLSSLAFAIKHAQAHGHSRIIYVIPYMSIIEQNAAVFRTFLDPENRGDAVLEHHSSFNFAEYDKEVTPSREKLASENWDAPVVATTAVQFFESLFAAKPSRCRKLHNIANSVIILDEAQMLPQPFLRPCLEAIRQLTTAYNVTFVLCTATQPALQRRENFPGLDIDHGREMMRAPDELHKQLKRVNVELAGKLSDEELAKRIAEHEQVLCIVNTRKHAKKIYKHLAARAGHVFHLSANMCPAHRSSVIAHIKTRLLEGLPCRVVSTSLIEAGVDVDFPCVYRAIAGLDAIAQAAGRCDREGDLTAKAGAPAGKVIVFEPEDGLPQGHFTITANIASEVMGLPEFNDPMAPAAIEKYFRLLFWSAGDELDKKDILALLHSTGRDTKYKFRTAAELFSIIEDGQKSIIIPWDKEAQRLISSLPYVEHPGPILRSLQRYIVQTPPRDFNELARIKALSEPMEGVYALQGDNIYTEDMGLQLAEEAFGGCVGHFI